MRSLHFFLDEHEIATFLTLFALGFADAIIIWLLFAK